MFRAIPELWQALDHRRKTQFEWFINGIRLGFGWSGSGVELASHPVALVVADELDLWEPIPGIGDGYVLAKRRTATFPDGKIVAVSTPTLGKVDDYKHSQTGLIHWAKSSQVQSRIWRLFQEGTMTEFMVPCIHCGTYFTPKAKLVHPFCHHHLPSSYHIDLVSLWAIHLLLFKLPHVSVSFFFLGYAPS